MLAEAVHTVQAGGAIFYNGSEGSSLQFSYGALSGNSVSFNVLDHVKSGLGGEPCPRIYLMWQVALKSMPGSGPQCVCAMVPSRACAQQPESCCSCLPGLMTCIQPSGMRIHEHCTTFLAPP